LQEKETENSERRIWHNGNKKKQNVFLYFKITVNQHASNLHI